MTDSFKATGDMWSSALHASTNWKNLSHTICDHVQELIKDGRWEQLPQFEKDWLQGMVNSIRESAK